MDVDSNDLLEMEAQAALQNDIGLEFPVPDGVDNEEQDEFTIEDSQNTSNNQGPMVSPSSSK